MPAPFGRTETPMLLRTTLLAPRTEISWAYACWFVCQQLATQVRCWGGF